MGGKGNNSQARRYAAAQKKARAMPSRSQSKEEIIAQVRHEEYAGKVEAFKQALGIRDLVQTVLNECDELIKHRELHHSSTEEEYQTEKKLTEALAEERVRLFGRLEAARAFALDMGVDLVNVTPVNPFTAEAAARAEEQNPLVVVPEMGVVDGKVVASIPNAGPDRDRFGNVIDGEDQPEPSSGLVGTDGRPLKS